MALTGLFRFISSILSIYMILLFIRILLTWFRSIDLGRPYEILVRITARRNGAASHTEFWHRLRIRYDFCLLLLFDSS